MPNDSGSDFQAAYLNVKGDEIANGTIVADLDDQDDRKHQK